MTKRKTEFSCRGCGKAFQNPGKRLKYCSDECACWSRINVRGPDDCWLWTGGITSFGYGNYRFNGKYHYAHKAACALRGRPIPDGLEGCHSCDNPPCCNPAHIFPGTQADNMADMRKKGRQNPRYVQGEECGSSRLKEQQVLAIRKEYATGGITLIDLARRNACSASAIRRIVTRTHWRHI